MTTRTHNSRAGLYALGLVIFFILACASPSSSRNQAQQARFDAFKKQTLLLETGMSLEAVEKLLGKPTDYRTEQYGEKTKSGPWVGLTYEYFFKKVKNRKNEIILIFAKVEGKWILNSWDWY